MEHLRGLIDKDRLVNGVWTGYSPALERSILKKRRFLDPSPVTPEAAPESAGAKSEPSAAKSAREPQPHPSTSPFASKLQQALGGER
jgi:hypothetical protein